MFLERLALLIELIMLILQLLVTGLITGTDSGNYLVIARPVARNTDHFRINLIVDFI